MFLAILLSFLSVGFAVNLTLFIGQLRYNSRLHTENNRLITNLRNQDQDMRNAQGETGVARAEVKRVTNKLIEVQNRANLIEEDAKARMEEFKKVPLLACMTDNQVRILAEMLVIQMRAILEVKKEYVN